MKKSELVQEIKDLGLEYEVVNNNNVIIQIWQPYKGKRYKLGSKYYHIDVFGEKEVSELNNNFEKLIELLRKNKIIARNSNIINNGIISEIVIEVKNGTLKNLKLDFDIETDIKHLLQGYTPYDDLTPNDIGYSYVVGDYEESLSLFDEKMRKDEIELVLSHMDELFRTFSSKDSVRWMYNFALYQKSIEPFEYALKNQIVTPLLATEEILSFDIAYSEFFPIQHKKMFRLLSEFKLKNMDLDWNGNSKYKGHLPDIILKTPMIYKNVLKNWEMNFITGQKTMTHMIQNDYTKQFKQFVNAKDPFKYHFVSWDDLIAPILKTIGHNDSKFLTKMFKNEWLDFKTSSYANITNFLINMLDRMNYKSYSIIMHRLMEVQPYYPIKLLHIMFKKFDDDDLHDTFISRAVVSEILAQIKEIKPNEFKMGDGKIMEYLDEDKRVRDALLSDSDFIKYLIENEKSKYLPEEAKDIFLF